MKANETTISHDSFFMREESPDNLYSFKKRSVLNFNTVAGMVVIFSVFSLFVLSLVSILFSFGIEADLFPIVFAIMLSAAAGITAFILSYASAMIFE